MDTSSTRIRRVVMGKNVDEDARRIRVEETDHAIKQKARALQRDYRARNKDKIASLQRDYYARNKDKIASLKRDYYARNKDKWRTVYAANRRRRRRQQRAAAS